MRQRERGGGERGRERVKVVCHSARISCENNFAVANYVNHRHDVDRLTVAFPPLSASDLKHPVMSDTKPERRSCFRCADVQMITRHTCGTSPVMLQLH